MFGDLFGDREGDFAIVREDVSTGSEEAATCVLFPEEETYVCLCFDTNLQHHHSIEIFANISYGHCNTSITITHDDIVQEGTVMAIGYLTSYCSYRTNWELYQTILHELCHSSLDTP